MLIQRSAIFFLSESLKKCGEYDLYNFDLRFVYYAICYLMLLILHVYILTMIAVALFCAD